MRAKIIAVDFDGTLIEEGKWPYIGETNQKVLDYCKSEKAKGARIILWTNRTGKPLATAVRWCEDNGLQLDAVNANLSEVIEFFGTDTRKIYADEFIDDRMAKGFNLPYVEESKFVELTPDEIFKIYQKRYLDDRDPVINYHPYKDIPNAIAVEHYSGFVKVFGLAKSDGELYIKEFFKIKDEDDIPVSQVLDDMYDPNGGPVSWAARDYYRQHYATEEQRRKMDQNDKFDMLLAIIFPVSVIVFIVLSFLM